MDHCGMDVHKNETVICIITEAGELVEERIRTERGRFKEFLGNRLRMKILIEASTESEWVACCLEACGHEVIVADPNFAPMYAQRSRKIKTDRRDARALAEACRLNAYRPAHRTSDKQRHVRAILAIRDGVVRTRSRWISLIRSVLRREGFRIPSGKTSTFADRVSTLELSEELTSDIGPLLTLLGPLGAQIKAIDRSVAETAEDSETAKRLMTTPGVGPVIAVAYVATLDQADRFRGPHQVESYLGLVPQEWSSSEVQRRGSITKAGNSRMRWLLVQAAQCILKGKPKPESHALRDWADRIALRRGRAIATVALARRLAGILYAIWRDGTVYDANKVRRGRRTEKAA
jgi:transposase